MTFKYIDIHSHLNFSQFDEDRDAVIAEMKEKGIATITVGTDLKTSQEAVELASRNPHLFATIGIHPTHDGIFDEKEFEKLLGQKGSPERGRRVVAVGECGLDYFRPPIDKDAQKKLFVEQIKFAAKHNLPLMLHCRGSEGTMDAYEEALDILKEYPEIRGNFHFFAGTLSVAKTALAQGHTLSFDGPITFTDEYNDVIKFIPEDMIMAETDAPFAAPVPHRGKRNSPLYVEHVARHLAEIREEDPEAFRGVLIKNAERVFGLGNPLQ